MYHLTLLVIIIFLFNCLFCFIEKGVSYAGAVSIYHFENSTGWQLATTLQMANPTENFQFGTAVELSGRLLLVFAGTWNNYYGSST